MLPLLDETKRLSRGRETKICIQRRNAFVKKWIFFLMFKDFLVKNEGFEVLRTEKR